MKWIVALVLALLMVTPAMAGQDPYISIVGKDCVPGEDNFWQPLTLCPGGAANPYYFSPKHVNFMYDENDGPFFIPATFGTFPPVNQYTRVGLAGQEQFRSKTAAMIKDPCWFADDDLPDFVPALTSKTPAGNAGFYEYFIRVPKKPDGEINIVIECAVLKPNAYFVGVEGCAAETGERLGFGLCVRQEVDPGVSPVNQAALPRITAIAYPGPYNDAFAPFHLTAFKNPSSYTLTFNPATEAIQNSGDSQVLDGSAGARIMLKSCLDKTVVTKLPVTGQQNAIAGEVETDLEMGDLIYVRIDVPRQNTVDIYCSQQSVRIAGIGEVPF